MEVRMYRLNFLIVSLALTFSNVFAVSYGYDQKIEDLIKRNKISKIIPYIEQQYPGQKDEYLWTKMGYANEQLGNIEKSISCYAMSIKLDSNNVEAFKGLARNYKVLRKYELAYSFSKKVIDSSPSAKNLTLHAEICILMKKDDEAETILKKYPDQNRSFLINYYVKKKDYESALPLLLEQFKKEPSIDIVMNVLMCSLDKENELYYLEYVFKNSNNQEMNLKLARIYVNKDKFSQAYSIYLKIPIQRFSSQDYYNMGICCEVVQDSRFNTFYEACANLNDSSEFVLKAKFKIAKIYLEKKDYTTTLQYLKNIKSEDKEIFLLLAKCYDGLNDFENALIHSEKVLKQDTMNVSATFILAKSYEKKGLKSKANKLRTKLLTMKTSDPSIYFDLGTYYLDIKDYEKAKKYFEKSFILKENELTLQKISLCAFKTNDFDKAKDAAESILKNDPKDVNSREILSKIYLFKSDYLEASKNLEILISTGKLQYYNDLSTCYKNLSEFDKLAKIDEKIISLDKTNVQSRERLATYKIKLDKKGAIQIFEELAKLKPTDLSVKLSIAKLSSSLKDEIKTEKYLRDYLSYKSNDADVFILLGNSLYNQNNFDDARKNYEVALKIQPTSIGFYKNYAKIVLSKNEIQTIINVCEKTIRAGEADFEIYYGLSNIYLKIKNYKRALIHLNEAQNLDIKNMTVLSKIGFCQMNLNLINESIITYEQVVQMNQNAFEEMKNLSTLYYKKNDTTKAIDYSKKYLKNKKDEKMSKQVALYEYNKKRYKEAVIYFKQFKTTSDDKIYFKFIESQFYSNDFTAAITSGKDFLDKFSKSVFIQNVFKIVAVSSEKNNDIVTAVKYYKLYSFFNETDSNSFFKMAYLQEKLHAILAKEIYEKNILKFTNDYRNYQRLGNIYFSQIKDFKNAKKMYEKTLQLNDTCKEIKINLSIVYKELKDLENEIRMYKQILMTDPKNFYANKNLGIIFVDQKRNSEAVICLEIAREDNMNDPEIAFALGRVYFNENRIDEALIFLELAKKGRPSDCSIKEYLINSYLLANKIKDALKESSSLISMKKTQEYMNLHVEVLARNKLFIEAEKFLEEMRKDEPENIEILMKMALMQKEQNNFDEAVETYKRISYINSDYAMAIAERADTYFKAGKLQEAKEYYQKALKIDSKITKAYNGLAAIYKILNDTIQYNENLMKAKTFESQQKK
jgi:tetratricopeptide (TPR) repeat protein